MLITVPCPPRSELLRAPDHCSVLREVNFTNFLLLGGLWSESGWVLYDLSKENYKSRWVILGKELQD